MLSSLAALHRYCTFGSPWKRLHSLRTFGLVRIYNSCFAPGCFIYDGAFGSPGSDCIASVLLELGNLGAVTAGTSAVAGLMTWAWSPYLSNHKKKSQDIYFMLAGCFVYYGAFGSPWKRLHCLRTIATL